MYGTAARDLAILGCCENSTLSDIKSAYRSLARRLHGELQRKRPGACDQLVDINTAYDRLAAGWAQDRQAPPPRVQTDVTVDEKVNDLLAAALRKAAFKIAFESTRDPATGVYRDPRRANSGKKGGEPKRVMVSRVMRFGVDLVIEPDEPISAGRTLLAVPDLNLGHDGGISFGPGNHVLDFTLQQVAGRVRLDPARLRMTGSRPATCTLIQPR